MTVKEVTLEEVTILLILRSLWITDRKSNSVAIIDVYQAPCDNGKYVSLVLPTLPLPLFVLHLADASWHAQPTFQRDAGCARQPSCAHEPVVKKQVYLLTKMDLRGHLLITHSSWNNACLKQIPTEMSCHICSLKLCSCYHIWLELHWRKESSINWNYDIVLKKFRFM